MGQHSLGQLELHELAGAFVIQVLRAREIGERDRGIDLSKGNAGLVQACTLLPPWNRALYVPGTLKPNTPRQCSPDRPPGLALEEKNA